MSVRKPGRTESVIDAAMVLAAMPYVDVQRPPLGVSVLMGALRAARIPAKAVYPCLDFAESLPYDLYRWFGANVQNRFGDYFFANSIFGYDDGREQALIKRVHALVASGRYPCRPGIPPPEEFIRSLSKLQADCDAFLDRWVARICRSRRVRIVACSATCVQLMASLALLKRVKTERSDIVTMIGGCECEGEAALEIVSKFDFVDYALSGDGDRTLPSLVRRCLKENRPQGAKLPPGVFDRTKAQGGRPESAHVVAKGFGRPDHADYLEAVRASGLFAGLANRASVEFSRGCWKGERSHCTFCGINGCRMAYRIKSAGRMLKELESAYDAGARIFLASDTVLDLGRMSPVLERFRAKTPDAVFLCDVVATLTEEQISHLADCGVLYMQVGIESLHPRHVRLMRKGNSPCTSLAFLKFAQENHVHVFWNLLTSIPSDLPQEYDELASLLPLLEHLPPPSFSVIRFDRFSEYWRTPDEYGLDLVPMSNGDYLFPQDGRIDQSRLVMFFDNRREGCRTQIGNSSLEVCESRVREWNESHPRAVLRRNADGRIEDTRRCAVEPLYAPTADEDAVLRLARRPVADAEIAVRCRAAGVTAWEAVLERLRRRRLVVHWDGHWLSLVTQPIPAEREKAILERVEVAVAARRYEESRSAEQRRANARKLARLSITGVLDMLVIDVGAEAVAAEWNDHPDLKGLFHFDALELKPGRKVIDELCAGLARIRARKLSYAFVLLAQESDGVVPASNPVLLLLPYIRRFLHTTGVIVYSKSDCAGGRTRTSDNGSFWRIRRDEIGDLPQMLVSIFTRPSWQEEWALVRKYGLAGFRFSPGVTSTEFKRFFNSQRRYLTYRVMENRPGRTINIKHLGGGFSRSMTFTAVKGDRPISGEEFAAASVVVKIAPLDEARMERERYQHFIWPYIPNDVGRVEGNECVVWPHAAIAYSYAGSHGGARSLQTLRDMLQDILKTRAAARYRGALDVFDQLFGETLKNLHRVSPEVEYGLWRKRSSFPDSYMGEVGGNGFLGNWFCRIPVVRTIRDVTFSCQEEVFRNKDIKGFEYYTFYGKDKSENCIIEAADDDKVSVRMTGAVVNDLVEKRQGLRLGLMLWVNVKEHPVSELQLSDEMRKLAEGSVKELGGVVDMVGRIRRLVAEDKKRTRFESPTGIVHGDLNLGNIMVETRKGRSSSGAAKTWLIDFASTRRDVIAHDYSVLFTSVLGLWFGIEESSGKRGNPRNAVFLDVVTETVFATRPALPDTFRSDGRTAFLHALLRHIRKAALEAGISADMYALSAVLALLVAARISIVHEKNENAARDMLQLARKCLCRLEDVTCNRNG